MSNTDPVVPRLETSGTREPPRGDPPRTLGGTLATVALLVGLLLGVAVGGGAVVAANRRGSAESTQICVPWVNVCVRL